MTKGWDSPSRSARAVRGEGGAGVGLGVGVGVGLGVGLGVGSGVESRDHRQDWSLKAWRESSVTTDERDEGLQTKSGMVEDIYGR